MDMIYNIIVIQYTLIKTNFVSIFVATLDWKCCDVLSYVMQ